MSRLNLHKSLKIASISNNNSNKRKPTHRPRTKHSLKRKPIPRPRTKHSLKRKPIPRPRTSLPSDLFNLLIRDWAKKTKSYKVKDIYNLERNRYNRYIKQIKPQIISKEHRASLNNLSNQTNTSYNLGLAMKANSLNHYFELLGEALDTNPSPMRDWEDTKHTFYEVKIHNGIKQGINNRREKYAQTKKPFRLLRRDKSVKWLSKSHNI